MVTIKEQARLKLEMIKTDCVRKARKSPLIVFRMRQQWWSFLYLQENRLTPALNIFNSSVGLNKIIKSLFFEFFACCTILFQSYSLVERLRKKLPKTFLWHGGRSHRAWRRACKRGCRRRSSRKGAKKLGGEAGDVIRFSKQKELKEICKQGS